jgi:two-component system OmpR family response regulator
VRLLIVEDDLRLARTLRRGLQEDGYAVDTAYHAEQAMEALFATGFDALILDVMLPGPQDGFQLCAALRRRRLDIPVLMLTARDAVEDRVHGLDAGADDYLVKPFAFSELLARLRAMTRRHRAGSEPAFEVGHLCLDPAAHTFRAREREVELNPKEFAVLEYLMRQRGRVVTKASIEEHVWSYDFDGSSNLVEVYVARIRRKLEAAGVEDPIVTLRGVGYRFTIPG